MDSKLKQAPKPVAPSKKNQNGNGDISYVRGLDLRVRGLELRVRTGRRKRFGILLQLLRT
ncbi:hypothetical protein KXD40_007024 [Peronospora effusa]|nr:hypothetical protein KXD40_007024 [Peronospora effusa]